MSAGNTTMWYHFSTKCLLHQVFGVWFAIALGHSLVLFVVVEAGLFEGVYKDYTCTHIHARTHTHTTQTHTCTLAYIRIICIQICGNTKETSKDKYPIVCSFEILRCDNLLIN